MGYGDQTYCCFGPSTHIDAENLRMVQNETGDS